MSATARVRAVLGASPSWLQGVSWNALALVLAFCALSALNVVLSPRASMGDGVAEMAVAGLVRAAVFLGVLGIVALGLTRGNS